MVSVVVMTHSQLSVALGLAAKQIVGEIHDLTFVSIDSEVSMLSIKESVQLKIAEAKEGCILLVDLMGGSPFAVAGEGLMEEQVRVITGVNLPMLIALQNNRRDALDDLFNKLLQAGRDGIKGIARSKSEGGPLCMS